MNKHTFYIFDEAADIPENVWDNLSKIINEKPDTGPHDGREDER